MDVLLDASVERESDRNNLAPTASSTVALSLGHALAVALMEARQFEPAEFGRFHPAGSLGRALHALVSEVMHGEQEIAWVAPDDSLKQVVIAMTTRPLGAACVVDGQRRLAGLITDGDVRRALQKHDDIRALRASDVMTVKPVRVEPNACLQDALRLMEDRPSQISLLPVVDTGTEQCLGVIRLHDIYQSLWRPDTEPR
jgi:arabinose-5-phosphate isomerase